MTKQIWFPSKELGRDLGSKIFSSDRAKKLAAGGYRREFNAVLPGLVCNDRAFINFIVALERELSNASDLQVDTSRLRSYSGWKAKPAGHTMINNEAYRAEIMGLHDSGFKRVEHRQIFEDLTSLMFAEVRTTSLRVPSKSSQGLPTLETDRDVKVKAVLDSLKNWRQILTFVNSGDGESLLKLGILPVYVQNYRTSPDKFGKERFVADLDYAKSGGLSGKLVKLDYFDEVPSTKLQCARPRRVMGMHNVLNSLMGVYFGAAEEYYLNEYAFTFKHKDYAGMTTKVRSFAFDQVLGVDVSAFDMSVPRWLFDAFFDYAAGKLFNEEFAKFCKQLHFASVFEPEGGDGQGSGFMGHPLEIGTLQSPGLLSGIRTVSSFGKLFNVFNLLVLGFEAGIFEPNKDFIRSLLKGKESVKMWNAGDDCLLFFDNEEHYQRYAKALEENVGYFKVDVESPIKFLGGKLSKDDLGEYSFLPDLGSFLNNTFVPERPYTSLLRKYWPIGVMDRQLIYGRNPTYRDMHRILDSVFKHYYPDFGTFSAYCERIIQEHRHIVDALPATSLTDKIFVDNPDAIHYKIDPNDVSPELLSNEFNHVAPADQEEFLSFILEV